MVGTVIGVSLGLLSEAWNFAWSVSRLRINDFDSIGRVFLRSMIFQFLIDQGTLHVMSCQIEQLVT